MKKVYVAVSADLIHHGHIKVFDKAAEYGDIIIGLLTDKAISRYKRIPLLNWDQRKMILEHIKGVVEVIPQDTLDYTMNLEKIRPDYVVHGDDWRVGIQTEIRKRVLDTLAGWGGELIEIPYTVDVSSRDLNRRYTSDIITPNIRRERLQTLLKSKSITRFLEAHSGISALIVERESVRVDGEYREFDGIWLSSLTDSTAKGKPDNECIDFTSRLTTLHNILEITTKPVIMDGDTGGLTEHFSLTVKTLERLGVSAIIIEDKVGLKRNSLCDPKVEHIQDSIENFSNKIRVGKESQRTESFMIIARIESLILGRGMDDAVKRARAYITAGADGIMIHSKKTDASEILEFCEIYRGFEMKVPLVTVPSTYSEITEKELFEAGANIVIYANHLLRSAYPAMKNTALSILKNQRAYEASRDYCISIDEVLNLIPVDK